jgi:hypothetical protein
VCCKPRLPEVEYDVFFKYSEMENKNILQNGGTQSVNGKNICIILKFTKIFFVKHKNLKYISSCQSFLAFNQSTNFL